MKSGGDSCILTDERDCPFLCRTILCFAYVLCLFYCSVSYFHVSLDSIDLATIFARVVMEFRPMLDRTGECRPFNLWFDQSRPNRCYNRTPASCSSRLIYRNRRCFFPWVVFFPPPITFSGLHHRFVDFSPEVTVLFKEKYERPPVRQLFPGVTIFTSVSPGVSSPPFLSRLLLGRELLPA